MNGAGVFSRIRFLSSHSLPALAQKIFFTVVVLSAEVFFFLLLPVLDGQLTIDVFDGEHAQIQLTLCPLVVRGRFQLNECKSASAIAMQRRRDLHRIKTLQFQEASNLTARHHRKPADVQLRSAAAIIVDAAVVRAASTNASS